MNLKLTDEYGPTGLGVTVIALFIIFFIVPIVIAIFAVPCYYLDKYECGKIADNMNLEYKHGFWTGCMVHVNDGTEDGQWLDYSKVKIDVEA